MGLEEAGNVVYYGIVASFFGGWVPIRSKNIKLIVFHLYLFISMLVIPLIIYLVSSISARCMNKVDVVECTFWKPAFHITLKFKSKL